MRLGIVSALGLAAVTLVLTADKVIHTDNLDLRRGSMSLVCRARPILADSTSFKASIEELLLAFKLLICLRNLQLLLLHKLLETVLEFLFEGCLFLDAFRFPLFLLLLQIVDLLLKHFDVQLELLLNLDMVSNFSFIVLELRLVLLRWQLQRVERRSELASRIVEPIKATTEMTIVPSAWVRLVFILFKPALHDILEFGLDVAKNGQTGQIA